MIYLSTITPSKVILQTNKQVLPSIQGDILLNYYTFKITSCDTFQEFVFSPQNYSQSPYYDAFTVSVGNTVSMTGSAVMLNLDSGQYNFEVYKMPTEYNLNLDLASYITEYGILQVIGTASIYNSPQPITFTQSDSDTIKAFTEL